MAPDSKPHDPLGDLYQADLRRAWKQGEAYERARVVGAVEAAIEKYEGRGTFRETAIVDELRRLLRVVKGGAK